MLKIITLVFAALIAMPLAAAQLEDGSKITVSIDRTVHMGTSTDYNDTHQMVEYERPSGYAVGAYVNSENNVSVFAGKKWRIGHGYTIGLGIVTGYKAAPIAPAMQITKKITAKVEAFAFPAVEIKDGKAKFVPVAGLRLNF